LRDDFIALIAKFRSRARSIALYEGIPGGISSGAAVVAALEIGKRPRMNGKNVIVMLSSFSEQCLSIALLDEF